MFELRTLLSWKVLLNCSILQCFLWSPDGRMDYSIYCIRFNNALCHHISLCMATRNTASTRNSGIRHWRGKALNWIVASSTVLVLYFNYVCHNARNGIHFNESRCTFAPGERSIKNCIINYFQRIEFSQTAIKVKSIKLGQKMNTVWSLSNP